jgi:hypothetical protein
MMKVFLIPTKGKLECGGTGEELRIQPKTKGSGIMVSDFIDQHSGFLNLSDQEYALACAQDSSFPQTPRVLFEYGADKQGYWTGEKFMANVKDAVKIAKFKYNTTKHTLVFIFDQSSCHIQRCLKRFKDECEAGWQAACYARHFVGRQCPENGEYPRGSKRNETNFGREGD